ncbi:HlyD family efflux transporter periplasmic adaptor subunit [Heliobacterium gestii]|uniref:HlyD family efflux transporter periplasmic adaptor subunit n=1 Tax=Heliomicrobium gestii TaxID=2699 RepID=A0A845L5Q6_HELGE|nr:HlyD family efflux transporter periplasmic adaptor subunit [Heliomicrobium gestii]MBM7865718.1 HlyD family secretion protein [Heliomicrobium gestii]MZP41967.1 HlyD family efflux transporter periplasmic adaptor subunit [Heliomicrobium gestii]
MNGRAKIIAGGFIAMAAVGLIFSVATTAQGDAGVFGRFFGKAKEVYSGTIEGTMVPVQPEIAGRVTELRVAEGQTVEVGQVIALLDDQTAVITLRAAESDLRQAEAKLLDLVNGSRAEEVRRQRATVEQFQAAVNQNRTLIDQYKANLSRDEENLRHEEQILKENQALYDAGALSARELDNQKTRVKTSHNQTEADQAQLEAAQSQVASAEAQRSGAQAGLDLALAGNTEPTILAQKAVVDGLREKMRLAQVNADKVVLKSPVRGRVLYKHVESGQVVNTATRIVTILDENDLWVKVYVPEAQLGGLSVGTAASVNVDAYPGQFFAAAVTQISDKAEFTPKNVQTKEERTSLVFSVKTKLAEGLERLKPGMPADVVFQKAN